MNDNKNYNKKKGGGTNDQNESDNIEYDWKKIIEKKDYDKLVSNAEKMGKKLVDMEVKSTQFRRIFTLVKRIHTKLKNQKKENQESSPNIPEDILKEIYLLKPKMAYTAGRHKNLEFMYEEMKTIINEIKNFEDFDLFYHFIEATLAYHKYNGGKD